MKRFIIFFLATIGVLAILFICLLLWGSRYLFSPHEGTFERMSPKTILTLSLGKEPLKESSESPFGFYLPLNLKSTSTLKGVLVSLEQASTDNRVQGILLTIDGGSLGLAQAQELRQALINFRKSGKFVYAFADTFGEFDNGTMAYYLATAANKIWLQPSGTLGLTGLLVEVPFVKDALDSLKILPRIERREQYKSLPESLTENDISPSYRENLQDILENLTKQLTADMATSRQIDIQTMEKLMNQGPFLGTESISHKLIDDIGYFSTIKAEIEANLKKEEKEHSGYSRETHLKPTYMPLAVYGRYLRKEISDKIIALVCIEGIIKRTPYNSNEGESEEWELEENTVVKGLRQARYDPAVKAVILRLNTGGGSVIASETIWHEVKEIVAAGKPVIASMGDVAASGGYFIATAANKIVANPASLTGSIGVYSGKIITAGLWDHVGVHWRSVSKNDNATMWSSSHDFNEYQTKRHQAIVDEVYDTFQKKVMQGRNMSRDKVHALAKGRVWTGQQSFDKGLVDALGGLTEAISIAKKEVSATAEDIFEVEDFPRAPTPFQMAKKFLLQGGLDSMDIQAWTQRLASHLGIMPRNVLEAERLHITGG